MRIEIQWNSLFPLSMPYVTTLQYQEIFWQNGSLLYGSDTAKQEFFMRLQLRLQSLHKHDFISNQLLFYCWLTQQHFNFSVSFSFNMEKLLTHKYPCTVGHVLRKRRMCLFAVCGEVRTRRKSCNLWTLCKVYGDIFILQNAQCSPRGIAL